MSDIEQLRCFVAVADLGSFRAAAEAMDRSQPAVSRSVARLQETIEERLLEPDGRGVRVTLEGRRFAERARDVLTRFDRLRAPDQPRSTFVIAAHEPFSAPLLPIVLAEQQDAPGDVVLLDEGPVGIDELLVNGVAQVGISTHPGSGAHATRVGTMRCRTYAGARLENAAARELPWVAPVDARTGIAQRSATLDAWPADAPRDVTIRVSLLASALELCALGHARAWLPDAVVAWHNERVKAPFRLQARTGSAHPAPVDVPVFLRAGAVGAPDDARIHALTTGLARLLAARP